MYRILAFIAPLLYLSCTDVSNQPIRQACVECYYVNTAASSNLPLDTCLQPPKYIPLPDDGQFTASFCLDIGEDCDSLKRRSISWLTFSFDRSQDGIVNIRRADDKEENKISLLDSHYEMKLNSWVSPPFVESGSDKVFVAVEVVIGIHTRNTNGEVDTSEKGLYTNQPGRTLNTVKCYFKVSLADGLIMIDERKSNNLGKFIDLFGDVGRVQVVFPFGQ